MTYKELYESAADKLEKSKITLGEFEKMIEPLNAEIDTDSDTISRAKAIEALEEQIEQCNKSLSSFDISIKDEFAVKVERASLVAFRETLEYLPPAQLSTNLAGVGTDCISRQQAIETFKDCAVNGVGIDGIVDALEQLPPIQPEIIRCKDCKFWTNIKRTNRYWCKTDDGLYDLNPSPNDFCSRAERRTDERTD